MTNQHSVHKSSIKKISFLFVFVADTHLKIVQRRGKIAVVLDVLFYFRAGVHDRRMIAVAEFAADVLKGYLHHVFAKIHGDLPWIGDIHGAALGKHGGYVDVIIFGHGLLYILDGKDLGLITRYDALKNGGRHFHVDLLFRKLRIRDYAVKAAFQLTNIGIDLFRNEHQHVFADLDILLMRFHF